VISIKSLMQKKLILKVRELQQIIATGQEFEIERKAKDNRKINLILSLK